MNREKIAYIRDIFIIGVVVIGAIIFGAKYILPAVLPFIIAWSVAFIVRRPSDVISGKLKINKKIVRPIIAVLLISALVGGVIFALVKISDEVWDLISELSRDGMINKIISYFSSPFDRWLEKIGIDPELSVRIEDAVIGLLSSVVSSAAGAITSVASAIPGVLLFIIVTAISAVYFAIDLENVNKTAHKLLPKALCAHLTNLKDRFLKIIVKYIRSYALIMLITFGVMLIGLSILKVQYSLLMAIIIAALDMLPVIGIGVVLIPWGIFMLTVGENAGMGIGLLILWGAGSIIRQVIEPKIVGRELGMHPLLTLVLMYSGYSLFGFAGLVLLPFLSVFISIIPPRSKSESASESSDKAV